MTPEPLKGKEREFEDEEGFYHYFAPSDVKSAIEGCLEEVLKEIESYERDNVRKIFKKWFEDVM